MALKNQRTGYVTILMGFRLRNSPHLTDKLLTTPQNLVQ